MPKGRRKKKNGRNDSRKIAAVESSATDALSATPQIECFDKKVVIAITDYRVRLADTDGVCEKFVIDAIVDCGILKDDSSKQVSQVIKNAPVKVKNLDEEKTVIEIYEH